MKKKLVFATNNLHKLEEVSHILANTFDLLSLKDINCYSDIPLREFTLPVMPVTVMIRKPI